MATPHYVAKRVGDEYVMVRSNAAGAVSASRLLLFGGTATGIAAALTRGKTRFALGGTAGAMLAAWGAGLLAHRRGRASGRPGDHASGPSFPQDYKARQAGTAQRPADDVEEASMESFPASDPPARHRTTAAG